MNLEIIQQDCAKCGKPIECLSFARINEEEKWLFFCCPECVLSYIKLRQIIPWNAAISIRNPEVFSSFYNN